MKGMDTHLQELVAKAEGKWRNVIGKLEPLQEKLREFLATPLVDEAGPSASADELEAASFGFDDEILEEAEGEDEDEDEDCLLYTSPSPRDGLLSRMPSSA